MLFFAYLSGLVAALTPCVAVLIPLVLYRFSKITEHRTYALFSFVLGFLSCYVSLALVVTGVMQSFVQNGFRMGLGLLFCVIALLGILNKLSPMDVPLFKHPFLLGLSFGPLVSFSPCTLPYLGVMISMNTMSAIAHLSTFGLGLITPSVAFTLLGRAVLKTVKANLLSKTGPALSYFNKVMNVVLLFAGGSLALSPSSFQVADVVLASAMLGLAFVIMFRAFFTLLGGNGSLLRGPNLRVLLCLSGMVLIFTACVFHCAVNVTRAQPLDAITTNDNPQDFLHPMDAIAADTPLHTEDGVSFFVVEDSASGNAMEFGFENEFEEAAFLQLQHEHEKEPPLPSCPLQASMECPPCRTCAYVFASGMVTAMLGMNLATSTLP